MALGTAFHAVLEAAGGLQASTSGILCDGFHFPDATMRPMLDLIDRRGTFEVKATKAFGPHTVVAKADQIVGTHVYEHKTTTNPFDPDKYLQAYQWRFEAAIFQPVAITYRVAILEEPKERIVGLKSVEQVTVYPYPELERDCAQLVDRFVAYVRARDLTRFLERQGTALEAA